MPDALEPLRSVFLDGFEKNSQTFPERKGSPGPPRNDAGPAVRSPIRNAPLIPACESFFRIETGERDSDLRRSTQLGAP